MKCGEGSLQPDAGGANELRGGRGLTVAVNQPYIFPYLGYFQLLHAADVFVVYDDVQWINRGWINRNRVLAEGHVRYITLPVSKPSVRRKIKDYHFSREFELRRRKLIKQLARAYAHAPFFENVMPLVEQCLSLNEPNVSRFVVHSLRQWCLFLGLETKFVSSSDLNVCSSLSGERRVLALCAKLGATRYINLIGGTGLYDERLFTAHDIELRFVQMRPLEYRQVGGGPFVGNLSIIDVAMNNPLSEVRRLLAEYDLVKGSRRQKLSRGLANRRWPLGKQPLGKR